MMKVAVIGCGLRACHLLRVMKQHDTELQIAAIADINRPYVEKAASGLDLSGVEWYADARAMLDDFAHRVDGVLVGTRCSLHARLGALVMSYGIPLFLEKPVATTFDDLHILQQAAEKSTAPVVVSFPLRLTSHCQTAKRLIDEGLIGEISHVEAANNVPYGRCYYKDWYRDEGETGGLFLQKATHDLDVINYLVEKKPLSLCAMKFKRFFKGSMPAGLRCPDCGEYLTCPESTYRIANEFHEVLQGDGCSFARDTGNEDSGSVIIRYEDDIHAVYTQNFVARKGAARRLTRVIGYLGTVEFDFFNDRVYFFDHRDSSKNRVLTPDTGGMHFGGDDRLAELFIRLCRDGGESDSPIDAGLLSARMCLYARKSARESCFSDII